VIAIACGCLAAACLYSSPEVKPAPKQEDAPRRPDFTIGAYLSMTGPQASFGIATSNGIALAVEEQNRAGGVRGGRIRLRTIDTAGKMSEAATAVTRLVSDEGAIALLGEVASSLTLAGGAIAQQAGVPMISPSATHPDVTAVGDMIWRACALDAEQAAAMAAFARHRLRIARVAVLYDASQPYSSGLATLFEQAFARLGGTIATSQAFSGVGPDLQAQLEAIRDAKVDAIFVPVFYALVGHIAPGLRALGVTAPLLGADGWDSPELARSAGAAIDGSYYTTVFAADDPRPIVRAFVTRYRAKHGADPDGLAALGYDAARLLFDAMSRARSRSGEDLAAAIGKTRGLPGVTGSITMGPDREPKKPIPVLQLRAGKPVLAATMPPR
jgi:branched-chain amino acid transport system substrate-binding protein